MGGPWVTGGFVAFLIGGWVYAMFYRRTGGNTASALMAAGAVGILVFLIAGTILGLIAN